MDIVETLRYVGSVARTKTLLQHDITKRALARSLDSGLILRPQRGVFALPDAVPEFRAAVLHNGLATCASAAGHYDLWLLYPPKEHHVSCPDGSSGGHINHELRTVTAHHTLPMVGMIDVLLHALRCLPELEAVIMVEGIVRRGEPVKPLLLESLKGNRNGKARVALGRVTGCADSAIEVVARLLFRDAGIHTETQVHIPGVGRVDFLLEGFLVVEMDGAAFHSDRRALRRDRRRNNMTILDGYLVLRYCYEDIMFDRGRVLAEIQQVLAGRVIR